MNAAADTHFLFSVDDHPLTFVASDGQPVEPVETDGVIPEMATLGAGVAYRIRYESDALAGADRYTDAAVVQRCREFVERLHGKGTDLIGYFDQLRKEYRTTSLPSSFEIGSGIGNVSLKDGKPFVHLHVVATGPDGAAVGGHLMEGTKVYVIEAYVRQLGGEAPVRVQDDEIGLAVWR